MNPDGDNTNVVKRRPAETGGVAAAIAGLICKVAGVDDPDTLTYIIVVVGFVPAGITYLKETFGH